MSFDEWFEKNGELYREPTNEERYLFEAGAASRQAEIDTLQKRINEALCELIVYENISVARKILKGEK